MTRTASYILIRVYLAALSLALIAGAAGCGSSGSHPTSHKKTSVVISGQAVQNGMDGATIEAFAVNTADGADGVSLGETTTDSDGNYSLELVPAPTGPIRVTASGGSFVSEANGATITQPGTISVLLAKVHSDLTVNINPLTDFINSQTVGAVVNSGTRFKAALDNSTSAVEEDFGLSSDPSTLTPDYTAAGIGTDAGNLGLVLGAIINEDQLLCPGDPGGLAAALSADLADGVFDATSFGAPVAYCDGDLPAIAGTAELQDAMSGLQEFGTQITSGFVFGGAGNILTANGVAASQLLSPIATINQALTNTAPAPQNSFAAPADTPTMNVGHADATATLLPDGDVLIAGGFNDSTFYQSSTELYNPATNSFAAAADTATMNVAREFAVAALLPNGQVLIAGGFNPSDGYLASTELYDPAANTFAVPADTASMNTPRWATTATLLPNGDLLIAGGSNDDGDLNSTELYDPATNSFAPPADTATMNVARDGATATLLPNGELLIAGGFNGSIGFLGSTELYNPANNSFAPATGTAMMNTPRVAATASLLPNGKVLIAGGLGAGGALLNTTELYDPVTNSFAPAANTPTMNTARMSATATLLPNGKVLIAGGLNNSGILSTTELYDPATNSFAAVVDTATMNAVRQTATATLLPNGKVLIAGGNSSTGYPSSTELYTP